MDQSTVIEKAAMLRKISEHSAKYAAVAEEHSTPSVDVVHEEGDGFEWCVVFWYPDGSKEKWRYHSGGTFHLVEDDEFINNKEKFMSDGSYVRKRITMDILVDPGTASPRAMAALANEAKEYTEVVLVKDREIRLVELGEVIDVHDHVSTPEAACHVCVAQLAMDERR